MGFTNLRGMSDPSMTSKNGEQEIYCKGGLIVLLPCVGGSPCVLTIWKLLKEIFLSPILHGGILIASLPYVEDSPCVLMIWKLLEEVFLSPILRGGILSYYSSARGDSIWLLYLLTGDSVLSLCLREGEFDIS